MPLSTRTQRSGTRTRGRSWLEGRWDAVGFEYEHEYEYE